MRKSEYSLYGAEDRLRDWQNEGAKQISDELEKNHFFVADRKISLSPDTPEKGMDLGSINELLMNNDVAAWAHVGHGQKDSGELMLFEKGSKESVIHVPSDFTPQWPLSYIILWSCYAGKLDWSSHVAQGGKELKYERALLPNIHLPFSNGDTGTRAVWSPL